MPVAADYDGDGKSDVAVYRSTTGQWFINQSKSGALSMSWGSPALLDLPVPGDYDGDNRNDVAVYRRTSGDWLIRLSTTGQQKQVRWGATGNDDAPVPGDYNGNGVTDIAVFRRSTGQWFVLFDNQTTATWSWGSLAQRRRPGSRGLRRRRHDRYRRVPAHHRHVDGSSVADERYAHGHVGRTNPRRRSGPGGLRRRRQRGLRGVPFVDRRVVPVIRQGRFGELQLGRARRWRHAFGGLREVSALPAW